MTTLEDALLQRILFIGEKLPDGVSQDDRPKFVLLGTPQELLDQVNDLASNNPEASAELSNPLKESL